MIKRIFILFNIGLITLGTYFGVTLFYQVLVSEFMSLPVNAQGPVDPMPGSGQSARGNGGTPAAEKRFADYQAILDRDLFKTAEAETSQQPDTETIEVDKLKETKLNLRLWGTVTGSAAKAYAVIEDKTKREQGLYHKGDAVQNATIKMILRKKVVLRVDGKDEILVMEEEKNAGGRRTAGAGNAPEFSRREPAGAANIRLDRNEINSVLNNINQLMQQAKVRPYFKDGKPSGLLLTHIRQNSIFTELGLKSGDIVKGVNGKEIRSVDDALEFYNNLKNSSSVQLEIERRGQTKSLSYQIF